MAGTITRGNLPRLLVEGINKVFGQTYTEHPVEWTKILDTETSKKAFELDQMVEGMGLAGVKTEGSDVPLDDFRLHIARLHIGGDQFFHGCHLLLLLVA